MLKVLIEPVSGAVVNVMRWRWREAEDWALWIGAWPSLRLFISDLGTDLVGAVPLVNASRDMPIVHQGDHFHENSWWTEKVFEPLSRRELHRAPEALVAWDGATRVEGPGRRVSAATVETAEARRAQAEEDFHEAVRLTDAFSADACVGALRGAANRPRGSVRRPSKIDRFTYFMDLSLSDGEPSTHFPVARAKCITRSPRGLHRHFS